MTRLAPLIVIIVVVLAAVSFFHNRSARPAIAPTLTESAVESTASAGPTTNITPTPTASTAPSPTQAATKPAVAPVKPTPATHLITITAAGFSPAQVSVQRGDTVTFVNNDTDRHWPASNPHPIHTDCSGFDANRGLARGEHYSFTYDYDRSCAYHDHLHPRLGGQLELTR